VIIWLNTNYVQIVVNGSALIAMMDAVLSVVIVLIIPIKLIRSSLWLCKKEVLSNLKVLALQFGVICIDDHQIYGFICRCRAFGPKI